MDTKLKKGKQIRAMIYRAISFGLLIMTIVSATTGYKALTEIIVNWFKKILEIETRSHTWRNFLTKSRFEANISLVFNRRKGYEKEEYTSFAYQRESSIG